MPKKGQKNEKNIFFCFKQMSKCDTYFYTHFLRVFQNIVSRSVALVTNLWAILDFVFTDRSFLPPRTLPYELKKK